MNSFIHYLLVLFLAWVITNVRILVEDHNEDDSTDFSRRPEKCELILPLITWQSEGETEENWQEEIFTEENGNNNSDEAIVFNEKDIVEECCNKHTIDVEYKEDEKCFKEEKKANKVNDDQSLKKEDIASNTPIPFYEKEDNEDENSLKAEDTIFKEMLKSNKYDNEETIQVEEEDNEYEGENPINVKTAFDHEDLEDIKKKECNEEFKNRKDEYNKEVFENMKNENVKEQLGNVQTENEPEDIIYINNQTIIKTIVQNRNITTEPVFSTNNFIYIKISSFFSTWYFSAFDALKEMKIFLQDFQQCWNLVTKYSDQENTHHYKNQCLFSTYYDEICYKGSSFYKAMSELVSTYYVVLLNMISSFIYSTNFSSYFHIADYLSNLFSSYCDDLSVLKNASISK